MAPLSDVLHMSAATPRHVALDSDGYIVPYRAQSLTAPLDSGHARYTCTRSIKKHLNILIETFVKPGSSYKPVPSTLLHRFHMAKLFILSLTCSSPSKVA